MSERNVFKFNTNELFRDNPYTLIGANLFRPLDWYTDYYVTTDLYKQVNKSEGGNVVSTLVMISAKTDGVYTAIAAECDLRMSAYPNDKIYIHGNWQCPINPYNTTIILTLYLSNMQYVFEGHFAKNEGGTWETVSRIIENESNEPIPMKISFGAYSSGGGENFLPTDGRVFRLQNFGIINLTAVYGAGNEPSLAECEEMYEDLFKDQVDPQLKDIIKDNILQDYKGGLITAKHNKLACLDVYDTSGNLVYDFSKGEMLQVGDVVRIDKDNEGNSLMTTPDGSPRYFQVVGRTFSHAGVPLLSPVYREVKL